MVGPLFQQQHFMNRSETPRRHPRQINPTGNRPTYLILAIPLGSVKASGRQALLQHPDLLPKGIVNKEIQVSGLGQLEGDLRLWVNGLGKLRPIPYSDGRIRTSSTRTPASSTIPPSRSETNASAISTEAPTSRSWRMNVNSNNPDASLSKPGWHPTTAPLGQSLPEGQRSRSRRATVRPSCHSVASLPTDRIPAGRCDDAIPIYAPPEPLAPSAVFSKPSLRNKHLIHI